MKSIPCLSFLRSSYSHLAVALILIALFPVTVLSQSNTGSASLRGSAKIDGKFVVPGVMVVANPTKRDGAEGSPRPARVDRDGEYRIEDLSPGSYILVATGLPIKDKVLRVKILPGYSNVQDLVLTGKDSSVKLQTKVVNPRGQPMENATVKIYSSELPPSVCEKCVLAESRSNKDGEVEYSNLGGQRAYSVAISYYDEANKREVKLAASDLISIGSQTEARVELGVVEGAKPALTAKVLPDIQRRSIMERELANAPELFEKKIEGVVITRDANTFVVRDMNGVDTVVRLADETSVKTKGGFLRSGKDYGQTSILRGLNLEVTGTGNKEGELTAKKIRFDESDLRVARAVEAMAPLEKKLNDEQARVAQVEASTQRLSGQLEELAAVSNAARGGAKEAQVTAEAAVAGVNATNERISALDDYMSQITAAVNFRSGSAVLSVESKAALDEIAGKALNARGYLLEVSAFADSRGSVNLNRQLSQRRADAVIRYLVENHSIPLRRIVTPYGYGELNPVAENMSREGRTQNRPVEVKLLVNLGLVPATTARPNEQR